MVQCGACFCGIVLWICMTRFLLSAAGGHVCVAGGVHLGKSGGMNGRVGVRRQLLRTGHVDDLLWMHPCFLFGRELLLGPRLEDGTEGRARALERTGSK